MDEKKRIEIIKILMNIPGYKNLELIYHSNFELLISVLLSAQSKDHMVNLVTEKLFSIANTPKDILALGNDRLKNYIDRLGLSKKKSRYIIEICKIFQKKYSNNFPNNREKLESLPGIGRKSSNLILNIIFQYNTIAIDTHTFRVSNRTNFAWGKNNKMLEKKLSNVTPKKFQKYIHLLFNNHGKKICKARRPLCKICDIKHLCDFKYKNLT